MIYFRNVNIITQIPMRYLKVCLMLVNQSFNFIQYLMVVFDIYPETIKNKSICEIPIVENSKLYSDAILNKV